MNELPAHRLAAAAVGPFLLLLIVMGFAFAGRGADASHIPGHDAGSMDAMSIDLDVTGNTATTLGPREDCIEVSPGDTVTFDVAAEGIPATNPMVAFHALLKLPTAVVPDSYDIDFLLSSSPGSTVLDPGGQYYDQKWFVEGYDFSDWRVVPPESGLGVLARATINVVPSAAPGAWPITILEPVHIDTQNNGHLAGVANDAILVVGGTCANPPTMAPTAIPTPIPSATPPLTPTPTVAPPQPTTSGMEAMSIDLDTSGNTATSLGPREDCIEVAPGDAVTFDVTAEGIPAAHPMIAFAFEVGYPQGKVRIVQNSPEYMMSTQPGSNLFNASEPMPDVDGQWYAAAADIGDIWTTAESGSGVLLRGSVDVDATAPDGLYTLTLTNGAHIDPVNAPHLPAALNWGFVAVGVSCENLPTQPPAATFTPHPTAKPTPVLTPTPTVAPPPPGTIPIGFDHNGGAPDINNGPKSVASGTVTVQIVVEAPTVGLGAWEFRVNFDYQSFSAVSCTTLSGVCNPHFSPYAAAFAGATASEVHGTVVLGELTLQGDTTAGACTYLLLALVSLADPTGTTQPEATYNGSACVGTAASPDGSTPLPTALPTPAPTYPPFPSPTPGGTAVPTALPDGGPPVSEPTAAAQPQGAATSAPIPSSTPTLSAAAATPTPSPTALGAVALPQTGGSSGGASPAVAVSAIGVLGLVAGAAAWLSLRRRPERS